MSRLQLEDIFGEGVDYNTGNEVLRILHGRRVTGALVDRGIQMDEDTKIPKEALNRALDWLRQKYPVDEQIAAELWAEAESAKVNQQYIERAEQLGLYKRDPDAVDEDDGYSTTVTGRSAIDDFKAFHEERRKREKEERKKSGEEARTQKMEMVRQEEKEKGQLEMQDRIQKRREERARKGQVSEGEINVQELSAVSLRTVSLKV